MAVAEWLIAYLRIRTKAKQQANALMYPDDGILEVAIQKIRKWHFGILSLATIFVPYFCLYLSLVMVFIVTDNGGVNAWVALIPPILIGTLDFYSEKIRAKAIRTILELVANGRTNKPMHQNGGSAVS